MSNPPAVRKRDRTTLPLLLLLAFVVGGGVFLRVRYLQREMLSRWHVALDGGVITTQATVDEWVTERKGDAEALAASVALHANLTASSGNSAGPFTQVLTPVARRGKFIGIWVLDADHRVLAQWSTDSLRAEERAVARAAREANGVRHSAVIPLGPHAAFLSFGVPVPRSVKSAANVRPPALIVLRTDVVAAFSPWAKGRPNAAMSLLSTPTPDGAVVITACPEQAIPVCIAHEGPLRGDSPSALALAGVDTFGVFSSFDGYPILAATRFDPLLGWGIVRRVRFTDAVVPLYTEMAIEGAFLAVLLALAAVAAYAYNRTVRVRRLSAQREAAGRLAVVLDASTDGIISLDENFTIRMVNGAVERLLGYSRESMVGRSVFTLFAERWHAPLTESLRAFTRSGRPQAPLADTERCVAICADGRHVLVDARVGHALIEGLPLYVMGLRDVSERARTELFRQGQRQVLELIATGAPPHETMTQLVGVLQAEASQLQCAVYVLDEEWQTARIVSAPSLSPEFKAAFAEIVIGPGSRGGVVSHAIYRGETVLSPDVATDPLWDDQGAFAVAHGIRGAWAIPLRAADGRIIGALACFYDEARPATPRERELARAAVHLASIALSSAHDAASLRASEASFRSFVENAPAAIFRETRRGMLVSTNPAMVALLGYSNPTSLAQAASVDQLYHDPDARARLLVALETDDVVRGLEVEWRRADGSLVTVRLSAHAYRDDRGEVWLWEGYAEDVTSLRATESALRQSERLAAVGQLISGVAHELNNPLSSIMHFAEDLLADDRSPADSEALSVIRDQARRSRAIVRDLLSFVSQRDVAAEPLVLGEVVATTARALRRPLEALGVSFDVAGGETNFVVLADRSGLEQIVTNLVMNAAQAAGQGGRVWIAASSSEQGCALTVEDSGKGIPDDVLPRIFDPFFTTKPTGEGTGLGLSVTLGIVEQFGGRIAVDPKVAGRGARFTVYLPCIDSRIMSTHETDGQANHGTAAAGKATAASESTPATPEGVEVPKLALIIDDEPTIRTALRRYFTRRGWTVEEAADGAAGLALIESHGARFGIIISDLRMPGFSGIELHDRLAIDHPEMLRRFVFSTGDVASGEAASFVQRTTCPVLQKPFELRMLDSIIAKVTQGAPAERVIT
ncbi:MAG: sensor protein [Gemmatimonadetes bacterium]|nr:sensor protein [Gemmatimonadota bacterium]